MTQRNLFGDLAGAGGVETVADHAPYVRGSETSKAAAEDIEPNAGTLRAKVFAALKGIGPVGYTDEELQNVLGMNPSTQRPRRIELVAAGLVADSGTTRKTRSGRAATVWVAT